MCGWFAVRVRLCGVSCFAIVVCVICLRVRLCGCVVCDVCLLLWCSRVIGSFCCAFLCGLCCLFAVRVRLCECFVCDSVVVFVVVSVVVVCRH